MYRVYGIPNCNTVKKALTHLDEAKKKYEFINFKKQAPTKVELKIWKDAFGDWPVNKKGPTYRKIKEEFEAATAAGKYKLLMETTSAIKRPIVMKKDSVKTFGYAEDEFNKL